MGNHFNCIYMYTNKINGKRYVGQAVNFNRRHNTHISDSYNEKAKYDYNVPFHRAIRKYGIENFEIKILAENISTQEKMNEYERFFIKRYDTLCKNNKGYNIASGGSNGNPLEGKTEEEIEQWKQKLSESHKGKIFSEEHKQKMSEANKGKKVTKETRQRISEAMQGENHPMYGKHHSEETKQKQSETNKGKKHTEETKQKMSEAKKGENHPQAKRVAQYDKQGNLIKIWDYIKQASEELSINHSSIIRCCKGKYKSAGGFIWRYAEETE